MAGLLISSEFHGSLIFHSKIDCQALEPGTVNVFAMHIFQMLGKEQHIVAEPIEVTVTE